MLNVFSCIPKIEQFSEFSNDLLQEKQSKFNKYAPLFTKWATHLPTYTKVTPIINNAYKRCEQYLDDVFLKQFPTKEEFWSRLWELFLCDFFITRDFSLYQNKNKEWTPDFCILHNNVKIWIEASMPSENSSIEKLRNWTYKLDEISNPRYLRLSNSFTIKANKWNSTYLNNGCDEWDPFIIAINWNSIDSWTSDKWILAILYWIGLTQIDNNGNISYQKLPHLTKDNKTIIETNYFSKPEFSHVSWVIYLESEISFENDDLVVESWRFQFVPNINAKNPVSNDFIGKLNLHIPVNFY